jgi:ribosomal protein S18 acetylase RimI-like enzyme
MNGITVREAHLDELDAAGSLVADAYLAQGGVDALDPGYLDHIRDARTRAEACPVLVAVEEGSGTLLGSVSYVSGEGNPFAEVERVDEAGFRMLGVAPWAQGRGVGEALVRACIDRARGDARSGIAISTTLDSFPAHRLYERLGFRRDPDRDFDPVPGVHLIAYVLAL